MTKLLFILIIVFIAAVYTGCQSAIDKAVRDTKYSAYEMIGIEKRDLFKKEVKNVKSSQQDTQEDFGDALKHLQAVYNVDGGKLEKAYKSLDSSYKDAEKSVANVQNHINKLEVLSGDLFAEWEKEIKEISSRDLRMKSSESLLNTQKKYNTYHDSLKKSEAKMAPVLARLKDQTLFLKHNLNAKVVAGLKTESDKIQTDINVLIKDMNESIAKADDMIKELE
ncbi:DUF2959 domain-containing protein [Bdellovibrio sp. qaytius]|nr:DUF2959 domain-containing protein [Bdellovibrio sp. qaytius]